MPDSDIIEKDLRRRRNSSLWLLAGGTILLILCLAFRFLPAINDTISGKPEPVHAIAEGMAQKIADRTGNYFAVILLNVGNQDCSRTRVSPSFDSDADTYYLVRYSEALHSVCVTLYARPTESSDMSSALVLTPTTGHNYGRRLSAPVKVVAVDDTYAVYPDSYLSLLNWRAKIDSSSFAKVGHVRSYEAQASPEGKVWLDVNVDFTNLRAIVARRHHIVDAVLNGLIVLCVGVILLPAVGAGILYRRFYRLCLTYDSRPGIGNFLWSDPGAFVRRAREAGRVKQQLEAERARSAILNKRAKEAVVHQLEAILSNTSDGPQSDHIRQCLHGENLEDMKTLLSAFRSQSEDKTSEERLAALLETLKEFCTIEEFDRCCKQAFEILEHGNFREARIFAVEMHDQFRARFRQAQQEEIDEAGGKKAPNDGSETPSRPERR